MYSFVSAEIIRHSSLKELHGARRYLFNFLGHMRLSVGHNSFFCSFCSLTIFQVIIFSKLLHAICCMVILNLPFMSGDLFRLSNDFTILLDNRSYTVHGSKLFILMYSVYKLKNKRVYDTSKK